MRRIDPFVLGIAIISIFVLFGGIVFAYKSSGKPMQTYSVANGDRPKAQIPVDRADLGEMVVSDIRMADFTIKNSGSKPLQISDVSTSCDCTFAEITIGGAVSPRFSMHTTSSWQGEIGPGADAKVTAIYEPAKMPVQGRVERTVHLRTNDPQKPDIALTLSADVK